MKRMLAGVCLVLAMTAAAPVWAQRSGKKDLLAPPDTQAYVLPWIVTIVVTLGGVSVVCLRSRRKREIDVSRYGDDEE